MKMPSMSQEVVDMQCEVERRGRIFFPDFCNLCLRFAPTDRWLLGFDWIWNFSFVLLFLVADITLFNVQDTRVLFINDVIWCEGKLWSFDLWSGVPWCEGNLWSGVMGTCAGNSENSTRRISSRSSSRWGIVALFLSISFSFLSFSLSCPLQLLSLPNHVSHIVTIKSLMTLLALECCGTLVEAWILRVKG